MCFKAWNMEMIFGTYMLPEVSLGSTNTIKIPQTMPNLPNIAFNTGFFDFRTILFAIVLRIEVIDTEL